MRRKQLFRKKSGTPPSMPKADGPSIVNLMKKAIKIQIENKRSSICENLRFGQELDKEDNSERSNKSMELKSKPIENNELLNTNAFQSIKRDFL